MVKKIRTVFIFSAVFALAYSCQQIEPKLYAEYFAVIKSGAGEKYFYTDDGLSLYPPKFDPKWGEAGDRILVGFFYNPVGLTEETTGLAVSVDNLARIPTHKSALPPTAADSVMTGKFLFDASQNITAAAWAAQNYLTVQFWVKYNDAAKHTFGFIEENEKYKNDTLFLRLWHNSKETNENKSSYNYIALDLVNYADVLNYADSTVISLKYDVTNAGTNEEKVEYATYYRKSGF
ncbi:MAG: hypothetical protein LBQ70_02400 [Prevotellaceae bacterium]|jgi:hypothetical protein|nr:hypothetical protein [Prevotellaceae bacterium]